jgi:hypothetical protein
MNFGDMLIRESDFFLNLGKLDIFGTGFTGPGITGTKFTGSDVTD